MKATVKFKRSSIFLIFQTIGAWMVLFAFTAAKAEIQPLFHPQGATLERIGELIRGGFGQIDLALYNVDIQARNPVIEALMSSEVKAQLESGKLRVRVIFEGYGASESNEAKMQALENLGLDVRSLRSTRAVHHKFGLFKGGGRETVLVTGSANWTLNSWSSYDENILFIRQEPELESLFEKEFDLLWRNSSEYGRTGPVSEFPVPSVVSEQSDTHAFFNSSHFLFSNGQIRINSESPGFTLTRKVVEAIENAKSSIDIATTRLKLRPVFEALQRAAQRGVRIRLLVSMDEFHRGWARLRVPECQDLFSKDCNSGTSYSLFLDRTDFQGHENVELRVKYYNLDPRSYLGFQMHNKYMIVDHQQVLTGSFNWSYSSEYENFENLVEFQGPRFQSAILAFEKNFDNLWELQRQSFESVLRATREEQTPSCALTPMSLSLAEISKLLAEARGKTCQASSRN